MKLKDVADQYGFSPSKFENFILAYSVVSLTGFSGNIINDADVPKAVEAYKQHLESVKAENSRKAQQQEIFEKNAANMVLTTCPSIDGYRTVELYGLVFGECVFKASLGDRISASLEDFGNMFDFSETEMSGIGNLLSNAREYAIKKMINQAVTRGANAIIGIDAESSTGGGMMHISIYGTAVKLEPIE